MKHAAVWLLALVTAGCVGETRTVTVTTTAEASMPPRATEGAGPFGETVLVEDFSAYLGRIDAYWERDPAAVVGALVGIGERDVARRSFEINIVEGKHSRAILTLDGLGDDSVRTVRYRVELWRNDDGTWDVLSGIVVRRCRAGRGHQDFSPEPCL